MKLKCTQEACDSKEFIVTVTAPVDWIVNPIGEYIICIGNPSYNSDVHLTRNDFKCNECGFNAKVFLR